MVGKLLCNSLNNFLNNAKLLRDAGGEIAIANPNICSFFSTPDFDLKQSPTPVLSDFDLKQLVQQ